MTRFRTLSRELLKDGYAVRFRAIGRSMAPAIDDGDIVTVAPVAAGDVREGDVLFYASDGRTVAHRVVRLGGNGGAGPTFITRGDARAECDPPVEARQILGRVIAVERAGPRGRWRAWRETVQDLLASLGWHRGTPQPPRPPLQNPPGVEHRQ